MRRVRGRSSGVRKGDGSGGSVEGVCEAEVVVEMWEQWPQQLQQTSPLHVTIDRWRVISLDAELRSRGHSVRMCSLTLLWRWGEGGDAGRRRDAGGV